MSTGDVSAILSALCGSRMQRFCQFIRDEVLSNSQCCGRPVSPAVADKLLVSAVIIVKK